MSTKVKAAVAAVAILMPITAASASTLVEHQKLAIPQIGTRGFDPIPDNNQSAGTKDSERSARSPMTTIVHAPDYDPEPESISRGTEP